MENMKDKDNHLVMELTTDVVSAYVSNNPIAAGDLSALMNSVYSSLKAMAEDKMEAETEKQKPAVSVKKSLNHEYLICLEDGKRFKSLKRHLKTHYDLSPEQYRDKWGLPADYPMVAPAYAEKRSKLAKQMGLGQKRS